MIGDEGSAFWVSRRAVKLYYRLHEGVTKPSDAGLSTERVAREIKEHFGIAKEGDILPHLYSNFKKSEFAGLCVRIAGAAREGDPLCKHVFSKVGPALARMIIALVPHMDASARDPATGKVTVTVVGSVWKSFDLFKDTFIETLRTGSGQPSSAVTAITLQILNERSHVGAAVWAAKCHGLQLQVDHSTITQVLHDIKG
jgi:N-acetylglucosamine kinase